MENTYPDLYKVTTQSITAKQSITGMSTGLDKFDDLTSGLEDSDLIIIAGRPSMGKTALALNIAYYAIMKTQTPVAIFSLEMSKEQLTLRLLAAETRIDVRHLEKGYLSEGSWSKIAVAARQISEAPLFIDDKPSISIPHITASARLLKAKAGLGLLIVDYMQLIRSDEDHDSLAQKMDTINRALKALAKELKIPVIALSQLDRQVDDRTNHRPQMADLLSYGTIEKDADMIIFLYRDEMYNNSDDNPEKGTAEIIVAKQRNGRTGTIKIAFLDKYICFENLLPGEDNS